MQNKNDMPEISCTELIESFELVVGDVVHISSDLLLLMWESSGTSDPITPDKLLDGIIKKIGPTGTLLLPTFNWGFCRGEVFDYKNTSSKTGSLSNVALKRNDFKRTRHPIYSFAVWGKDKEELCKMDNITSFGDDSPFAYLHRTNAKGIILDVDYTDCFTYIHYVEEQERQFIKYRYQKEFIGTYIDENGQKTTRNYSMYVRNLDMDVVLDMRQMVGIFEQSGVACRYRFFKSMVYMIRLGDAYPIIAKDIIENRSINFCRYSGQEIKEPDVFEFIER